jgi:DUF4097 and DUF4098 domain-containing protein YvlB
MKAFHVILLLSAVALAQDTGDKITVPFSDPARPRTVKGNLINSCFTVEGYDGKDVVVETRGGDDNRIRRHAPRGAEGLKRIDSGGYGLTVEEESNTISIHGPASHSVNVVVRVPRETTVKLQCLNGGEIRVTGVLGDLELDNTNGGVSVTNVSGSVIAHSLNGKVLVTLDRVTPNKPMSFSSLNGDVDVTFPADTRATLRMRSDNGEIYSDFEVKLQPNASLPMVEDSRSRGGKYKVKLNKSTVGTINGGGPDITFKTMNGNIFVRQKK